MDDIGCSDPHDPHGKGPVTVNRVFLEITVHFVGCYGEWREYCASRSRASCPPWGRYPACTPGQGTPQIECRACSV